MNTFSDFGIELSSRSGVEVKVTCPKCSATRKKKNNPCLNVNTEKGVWNCWHCGWSGSLGRGEELRPQLRKVYRRPDYVAKTAGIPDSIVQWFSTRGIHAATLRKYQIGQARVYFPQVEEEREAMSFPYMRGSEVITIKYRTRDKLFCMEAGCERVLYGLNDIGDTTVWVEGEIDKLSCDVAGYPNCVSVPDGAPAATTKNYETKFDFMGAPELDRVKTHIIAVDNDAPGLRLREELVRRLGPENCLAVDWPEGCKDANDVLVNLGAEALSCCIKGARPLPIAGAYDVSDFTAELAELYKNGSPRGVRTGWATLDPLYTVRLSDMTVVTGIPNTGKSEWLDALLVNLGRTQGWVFAMFSPESGSIPEHVETLAEKYTGKPFEPGITQRMTPSEWDMAQTWIRQRFSFIEPESPTLESILTVARQLVRRRGIRALVIDPWNEIEHSRPEAMTETEYISQSLSKLRRFARDHGVHVWIVAHPTKLFKNKDGSYPVPTPYDINGSAGWRNKADCCITIWRDLDPQKRSPDVEIHVQKIRRKIVGKTGMTTLKYDRVTGQYRDSLSSESSCVDFKTRAAGERIREPGEDEVDL
jgi:twinkle protein